MKLVQKNLLSTAIQLSLAAGILIADSTTALAQEAEQEELALEEVLVTARKREENLMEVPLAITVFDAQVIERAGIRNMDDVANLTPGLNFFNPIGEFLPTPVIRGMAPTDIFGETNAAVFIDGVYVSARAGLNFNQLDLERIEVNKGPQAAMYGRNAFSGAINLISAKPTSTFGSKAEARIGNDGILIGKASISGPIAGEQLMGRLAVAYDDWDGSYDNSLSGTDVGGHEFKTVQGSLLWKATDTFSMLGSLYLSDDAIDPNATASVEANCEDVNWANPMAAPRLATYCGKLPGVVNKDIPKIEGAWGETRELLRAQLNIDWDIGYGTLTSLTGYSDTEQDIGTDGARNQGEDVPYVYCSMPPFIPGFPPGFCSGLKRFTSGLLQALKHPDMVEQFSQEFRFSASTDRLSYDLGLNYFDMDKKQAQRGVIATQPLPDDFVGFGPFIPIVPNLVDLPIGNGAYLPWFQPGGTVDDQVTTTDKTKSWAVFGALDYKFNDKLNGRAEARYASDEKQRVVPGGEVDGSDAVMKDSWSLFSWRLGLDYQANEDWMIYGSVAHAEKPGKFDSATAEVLTDTTVSPPLTEDRLIVVQLDPELNTTIELGAKGFTAGGRASISAAIFYTDWEDIIMGQTHTVDPNTGEQLLIPIGLDTNAGSADIYGAEFETGIRLSDFWKFDFGVSWTEAKLKDTRTSTFKDFPSYAPDGDVSGNYLLSQPEWMVNGSLSLDRPVSNGWDLYGRLDVLYQSKIYLSNDNFGWFPSHTYVNLMAGLRNDNWSIELWARNLFSDDSPVSGFRDVTFNNTYDMDQSLPPASTTADFFPWRVTVTQAQLRTYGVTFRYRFGSI